MKQSTPRLKTVLILAKFFLVVAAGLAQRGFRGLRAWFMAGMQKILASFSSRHACTKSLRLRLCVFFSLFMIVAWLLAAFLAWKECREYIDEFFDSQQMLFAKTMAMADFSRPWGSLPKTRAILPGVKKKALGNLEDEAISFAVFSLKNGERVMVDDQEGRHIPFGGSSRGFSNVSLEGKEKNVWRILWVASADGEHLVAVGQELEYRKEMALDMLGEQIVPWLMFLPLAMLGLLLLLSRELAPLRAIALELNSRVPESTKALDLSKIPSEVLPMAESLNDFFSRTNRMLERERSFISDAAHELRTPLAGLRVQAQVAAQPGIAPEARNEALGYLRKGIDRCARLVDQILSLSRLEALHDTHKQAQAGQRDLNCELVAWAPLVEEFVSEYGTRVTSRGIRLESKIASFNAATQGYPALLSMLMRNLFENAARYTLENGNIQVTLESERLIIQNDCAALPENQASRLGERFFRPPGQDETGSGLGLSIVKRIADIHGFTMDFEMIDEAPVCSFKVTLGWAQSSGLSA